MIRTIVAILTLYCLSTSVGFAQMYKAGTDDGVPGDEMFQACGFCHGNVGQGRQRLDAPPIAGLQAWYVERQLHNFDEGIRGQHREDLPGAQMDIISGMLRNDATIENVAAYVETLEPGGPRMTIGSGENARLEPLERPFTWESEYASFNSPKPGNIEEGKKIYSSTCLACHGAQALGLENLGAPNLTVLPLWYMQRQMEYFRDGIRGADPRDTFGLQMAVFAQFLGSDQAIADVLAYVDSL
jgi:cytochrome c oxidase subunit II